MTSTIQNIEAMKPLGWFDADGDGFNEITQKWKSKYGDYTINTTNVKKVNSPFSFVYGGTNATLTNIPWPGLNKPYTFIHLTKYNGPTKKRIWTGTTDNWFSGFYFFRMDNSHAIGYYQLGRALAFGLDYSKRGDDWLLSIDMSKKIRINKGAYEIGYEAGEILSPEGITVNGGLIKDFSDFAIAEFLIFNRILSKDEYTKVEEYICKKYGLFGFPRDPSLTISSICPLTSTPVFVSGSVKNNIITKSKSKGWEILMKEYPNYNRYTDFNTFNLKYYNSFIFLIEKDNIDRSLVTIGIYNFKGDWDYFNLNIRLINFSLIFNNIFGFIIIHENKIIFKYPINPHLKSLLESKLNLNEIVGSNDSLYGSFTELTSIPESIFAEFADVCNKQLKPNDECMIMNGECIKSPGLVDYISVNYRGEKVYIKADGEFTRILCIDGSNTSKYYKGPVSDYKPCDWDYYTNAPDKYSLKKSDICYKTIKDIDYPDNNIGTHHINQTVESCKSLCNSEKDCLGFIYVNNNPNKNLEKSCFLKTNKITNNSVKIKGLDFYYIDKFQIPLLNPEKILTKSWNISWTSGTGSIMFFIGDTKYQAFRINIYENNTIITSYDGQWNDISLIITETMPKFHNNNNVRNPPLEFEIIFNSQNGFTIMYNNYNIYTYPNKFNILEPDNLKVKVIGSITTTEIKTSQIENTNPISENLSEIIFTKLWNVLWTSGIGSLIFNIGNSDNQAFRIDILQNSTLMTSYDGNKWVDIPLIVDFHNNNINRNPPLNFNIYFNSKIGFTIYYQNKNIGIYPNRFNITTTNNLKINFVGNIKVNEIILTLNSVSTPATTSTPASTPATTSTPTPVSTPATTSTPTPVSTPTSTSTPTPTPTSTSASTPASTIVPFIAPVSTLAPVLVPAPVSSNPIASPFIKSDVPPITIPIVGSNVYSSDYLNLVANLKLKGDYKVSGNLIINNDNNNQLAGFSNNGDLILKRGIIFGDDEKNGWRFSKDNNNFIIQKSGKSIMSISSNGNIQIL